LDGFASAVRIGVQESFFQYVKESIHLGLVVFGALLILHELENQVSADFDNCVS